MVKVDQEQLITNLVIAEDLIEKAKKYLSKGTIDINDYNDTLKHASKFVLDCTINELETLKIDNTQLVMASMLIDRANKDLEKVGGDEALLNKAYYNDSLKLARKLILESYID